MACSYQLITSVMIRLGTCKMRVGCWLMQMCGAQVGAKSWRGAVSRICMG